MAKKEIEADIKFYTGVLMTLSGEFMTIKKMVLFGNVVESNFVQLTGMVLTLWHIGLLIYLEVSKSRRIDKENG